MCPSVSFLFLLFMHKIKPKVNLSIPNFVHSSHIDYKSQTLPIRNIFINDKKYTIT